MPPQDPPPGEQLALFDFGIDIGKLKSDAHDLEITCSASPNTLASYRSDWRCWLTWCTNAGRRPLPAQAEAVALWCLAQLQEGRAVATVQRRTAAIRWYHRTTGHPIPSTREAEGIVRGWRRTHPTHQRRRLAIQPEQLRQVSPQLSTRDRAVVLLGFASGCRRAELSALDLADITPAGNNRLMLTIRRSKTDQLGRGRHVGIWPGTNPQTCPVAALRAYLQERGPEAGPLFLNRSGKRLSGEAINDLVKRCAKLLHLDPSDYGGHSLRAGCVTAAHEAGMDAAAIMQRTGHKSVEMILKYIRPTDVFRRDVLAGVL